MDIVLKPQEETTRHKAQTKGLGFRFKVWGLGFRLTTQQDTKRHKLNQDKINTLLDTEPMRESFRMYFCACVRT